MVPATVRKCISLFQSVAVGGYPPVPVPIAFASLGTVRASQACLTEGYHWVLRARAEGGSTLRTYPCHGGVCPFQM